MFQAAPRLITKEGLQAGPVALAKIMTMVRKSKNKHAKMKLVRLYVYHWYFKIYQIVEIWKVIDLHK